MKQYFIEFKHDSNHLGYDGIGWMFVNAASFDEACTKIKLFSTPKINNGTGYKWNESFTNARDFLNLTLK